MLLSGCISEPSSAAVFLPSLRRLALTRMTEAHFIRPLHHLHFPFYKALISLPPPSLSLHLTRSLSRLPRLPLKSLFSPLFHLIFSNLLRFPHLLSSRCLPPSLSLLGILQSHSQACEVKDLCNLLSPYSLPASFFLSICSSLYGGANLTMNWRQIHPIVNYFEAHSFTLN